MPILAVDWSYTEHYALSLDKDGHIDDHTFHDADPLNPMAYCDDCDESNVRYECPECWDELTEEEAIQMLKEGSHE